MKLQLKLMLRYMFRGGQFRSLSVVLSVLGMMFGVAAMVVAMAIISGYESTLRNATIDSFGHLTFSQQGSSLDQTEELNKRIKDVDQEIQELSPFLLVAGVTTQKGRVKGVFMEGVEPESHAKVLKLKKHIVEGELDLDVDGRILNAVVGKGLRKEFQLNKDQVFKVVVPVGTQGTGQGFRSKVFRLKMKGVVDLGRHDFDERYILVNLKGLQEYTGLTNKITGLRIRINDYKQASQVAARLDSEFGYPYLTRTWWDSNRPIFQAIEYEKPVIFVIVMLITVAAVFNIATSLFVSVFRRYPEISILRSVGATKNFILGVFLSQGFFIGLVGSVCGVLLGMSLCDFFIWIQDKVQLFPGDVYSIDRVVLEVRSLDLIAIIGASLGICMLATLVPALRGSRLKIVEGLRYE